MSGKNKQVVGGKIMSQLEACNSPSLQLLCIREGVFERKVKDLILILPARKEN